MKKPKSALLYFLAALGVIELITILFLGMWGFRPLIPDVAISPNWEAWQLLSTILLAIATLYLTWHIAKRQEQLTKKQDNLANLQAKKELETKELELKISLYDKRYKICLLYTSLSCAAFPMPVGERLFLFPNPNPEGLCADGNRLCLSQQLE